MSRPDASPAVLAKGVAAMLAASLVGCATPRTTKPPDVVAQGYGSAPAAGVLRGEGTRIQVLGDGPVENHWWRRFGSAELDRIVTQALSANPGLDAMDKALRAAQESSLAQHSALWPSVDLQYTPSRQRIAGNVAGATAPGVQGDGSAITAYQGTPASAGGKPPYNAPVTYTFHTAQVAVGYSPDVFATARALAKASDRDVDAQREELAAAQLALAGTVVSAALEDALLRQELELAEEQRLLAVRQLKLAEHLSSRGALSAADLAASRALVAQSDAALTPLRRQLAQNRNLLANLCGLPPDGQTPTFALDSFSLPTDLPVALPSALVALRPDVRAAARTLEATSLRAGAAHRALLPQLSLTAALGGTAAHFSEMFWSSGSFFSVAANLTQPVIHGGALRHQARAADFTARAAEATYRATVLSAFQNVADALHALVADADSERAAYAVLDAAQTASRSAHRQLEQGETDAMAALSVDSALQQSRAALSQVEAQRLADTAALYIALGGGSQEMSQ
jgi:NodT family efflux transporter outer membrane factor (OMF) lipoprotein